MRACSCRVCLDVFKVIYKILILARRIFIEAFTAVTSIDLQGPSVSETVNGYLKILGKVFSYEPLCMMHGVEILQWVVTDHESMLLEDTWILSCTFLNSSINSSMILE